VATHPIVAGIDISRVVRGMLPIVVGTLPIDDDMDMGTLPIDDDMDMDSSWSPLCSCSSGNARKGSTMSSLTDLSTRVDE